MSGHSLWLEDQDHWQKEIGAWYWLYLSEVGMDAPIHFCPWSLLQGVGGGEERRGRAGGAAMSAQESIKVPSRSKTMSLHSFID